MSKKIKKLKDREVKAHQDSKANALLSQNCTKRDSKVAVWLCKTSLLEARTSNNTGQDFNPVHLNTKVKKHPLLPTTCMNTPQQNKQTIKYTAHYPQPTNK